MNERLDKTDLLERYRLRTELADLCRTHGLSATGSKRELLRRLCELCDGIRAQEPKTVGKPRPVYASGLRLEDLIRNDYRNDEIHRAFFKTAIGPQFKFNTPFMKWMEENKGRRTYADAAERWRTIAAEKKKGIKTEIGAQFEYNRYTRAFFLANPGRSRQDCIACWNHKKILPGRHDYEESDLKILG